jgi:hypothetical protein
VPATNWENNKGLNNKAKTLYTKKSHGFKSGDRRSQKIGPSRHIQRFGKEMSIHSLISDRNEDTTFLVKLLEKFPRIVRARLDLKIGNNRYDVIFTLIKMTAGSDALGFREEFLLLQLKCNLRVGGQEHGYSFRDARNREDAAQRLHRFNKFLHKVSKRDSYFLIFCCKIISYLS